MLDIQNKTTYYIVNLWITIYSLKSVHKIQHSYRHNTTYRLTKFYTYTFINHVLTNLLKLCNNFKSLKNKGN